MVMPQKERPPYVAFELRSTEDREASMKAGHWVGKDTPFVIITPAGSKDRIERVADEWFAEKEKHVQDDRFPREWLNQYRNAYKAWRNDEEPPLNGVPIRTWPVVSPSQYKLLRDLRILTVEDLAVANEETLQRIGPGSRALKAKAEEWLLQASTIGVNVEEMERLRTDNASLNQQVQQLVGQVNQLKGMLDMLNQNPQGIVVQGGAYSHNDGSSVMDGV